MTPWGWNEAFTVKTPGPIIALGYIKYTINIYRVDLNIRQLKCL